MTQPRQDPLTRLGQTDLPEPDRHAIDAAVAAGRQAFAQGPRPDVATRSPDRAAFRLPRWLYPASGTVAVALIAVMIVPHWLQDAPTAHDTAGVPIAPPASISKSAEAAVGPPSRPDDLSAGGMGADNAPAEDLPVVSRRSGVENRIAPEAGSEAAQDVIAEPAPLTDAIEMPYADQSEDAATASELAASDIADDVAAPALPEPPLVIVMGQADPSGARSETGGTIPLDISQLKPVMVGDLQIAYKTGGRTAALYLMAQDGPQLIALQTAAPGDEIVLYDGFSVMDGASPSLALLLASGDGAALAPAWQVYRQSAGRFQRDAKLSQALAGVTDRAQAVKMLGAALSDADPLSNILK